MVMFGRLKSLLGIYMLTLLATVAACVSPAGVDDSYIGSVEQTRDHNSKQAEDAAKAEREREEFQRAWEGIESEGSSDSNNKPDPDAEPR